ncbi:MAG: extracellular solute-binding protein [Rhodospirillaceae bacterium]|nr:extracellular solute-binding protein [Rhodospirillaceae bacterium]
MTWKHPRAIEPLLACSRLWRAQTGVAIEWEERSLQDFESHPVEDLARRYDLIVIDHPHVGCVARQGCLVPLDSPERQEALDLLARQSVGPSFTSYCYGGRLWALPIDAATQVQAYRPDKLPAPARTWDEVLALAKAGRVLCPMRPPHSLMVFFTLAGNLGRPCATGAPGPLIDLGHGSAVYERMRSLMELIDPACYELDPIAVYERMAQAETDCHCVPLIYGYVNYGFAGFRPARIAFADIPVAGRDGPRGSTLGGTGMAVSARSEHASAAVDFAFWVASAEVQRGPYAAAGGQPGNAAAWDDPEVDARAGGFFRNTRATLEAAWVRPRFDGYMAFQEAAAQRLNEGLRQGHPAAAVIADMNRLFAASLR